MKNCPQCSASYPDEYVVCPKDGARLPTGSPWDTNSVIRGKYKILAKIGQGGMAAVYKAHHELLDEPRALKVIHAELARDEQFVKRFKNEAINTRKLQHPNAVRVDDLDIAEDGRPFIAMEMVEGESLKSMILRTGPVPFAQVLDIALQVCEALGVAHALGLTHRDIKPDNIVLIRHGGSRTMVKILDFGIARLKESGMGGGAAGNTLTETGVVIGTPDYMSPEQAMGKRGDEIDGRSDLYSLGIVMYRMLTGELPFKADTTLEMILRHIQDAPQPPQTLKPRLGIPDPISAIVMKALEKNREKRFASAAAMAEAIQRAQRDLISDAFRQAQHDAATMIGPVPAAAAAGLPVKASPSLAVGPPAPAGGMKPRVSQASPDSALRSAPAPKPVSASPALRASASPAVRTSGNVGAWPAKQKKKFPVLQTVAGIAALGLIALGVMRYVRQPVPTNPTVSPPVKIEEPSAPTDTRENRRQASGTKNPTHKGEKASHEVAADSPQIHAGSRVKKTGTPIVQPVRSTADSANRTTVSTGTGPGSGSNPGVPFPGRPPGGVQNQTALPPANGQRTDPQSNAALQKADEVVNRQLQNGNIRAVNDRATQLYDKGMYMRAGQLFQRVLQNHPDNQRARKGLEQCMEKMRAMRQQRLQKQ